MGRGERLFKRWDSWFSVKAIEVVRVGEEPGREAGPERAGKTVLIWAKLRRGLREKSHLVRLK